MYLLITEDSKVEGKLYQLNNDQYPEWGTFSMDQKRTFEKGQIVEFERILEDVEDQSSLIFSSIPPSIEVDGDLGTQYFKEIEALKTMDDDKFELIQELDYLEDSEEHGESVEMEVLETRRKFSKIEEKMKTQEQKIEDIKNKIYDKYDFKLDSPEDLQTDNDIKGHDYEQANSILDKFTKEDYINWMQEIHSQEVTNEKYLESGKIILEYEKFPLDDLMKKNLLLNDYYLIFDTDGYIAIDNAAGEYFVEEFKNKEVAIQYLRDAIEGTGIDKEPVDYLRLDKMLSNDEILNAIDEQTSKEILNKIVDTYPYQATVGEVYGIISIFDEDPIIGKNFASYEEALGSELKSIRNGENLNNVFEKIALSNYEMEYLKDNYGIDAESYKELAYQRAVLGDAKDRLLQLMDTDSYSRDENLILTQQKVVDRELSKFKVMEQKLNNTNITKQHSIQSIPKGQAFSMALNYSLADEVGYLKFVEELDEMISTIDDPSEIKGCLTIVFDGDEILNTENVSLEEIKNKICTADAEKIIDFAKETLREKITSGEDLSKYTQQYTTAIGVEKELAESMIQANELPIEGGISIG
ncbi:hypothetical protein [Breznakia pachnodae]|uniref:Uncharacterized protein n=1 Tax=Breznakia pachnodae TaxID=265178 RepID=A0ABU0E751_9FIRM|nr:hypothetical protein [Breznakia pachnodae]MDQ0362541.1 hypothetical protein [Breznakia pachnodae]